jgi:hypothetical protein
MAEICGSTRGITGAHLVNYGHDIAILVRITRLAMITVRVRYAVGMAFTSAALRATA